DKPARILGAVQRIVARGVSDGDFRPVDPLLTHLSLVGSLVFFFATARFRERVLAKRRPAIKPPDAAAYVKHIQDLLTHGLEAGQVIAVLDDEQIRAREEQASAAVRQADARVRLAQHQIAVLNEQLQQNRFGVDQARADAQGRVSEAEGKLAAAEAQLAQAEASHTQAKWDREAMGRLFKRELVAEQEARRAESAEDAQAAVVAAARRQVEAARGSLTAAQANLLNPAIRSSQVAAVQGQLLQAEADIAAAQAEAER